MKLMKLMSKNAKAELVKVETKEDVI